MNKSSRKKPVKATDEKRLQPSSDKELEEKAIERAVYDGMQDLRVKKFKLENPK